MGNFVHQGYKCLKFFSGMGASGRIKEHVGFYGNFILGMSFALLSMFYAIFFLKVRKINEIIFREPDMFFP